MNVYSIRIRIEERKKTIRSALSEPLSHQLTPKIYRLNSFQEEQLSVSKSDSTTSGYQLNDGKRKKTYSCEICGQIFQRSYQLNRHNFIGLHKRKPQNGPRVSQQNGNNITNESQWYDIQNVFHDMETYYKCPFCNEASTDLKILDEHIQIHNGKAFSYICELCDKVLPYPKYLKNHVISHTLNHFHQCDICERSFSSLPSLIKHEHSCHGKGMQTTCYQCKKVFDNNNLWLSHSFRHTLKKPYICDICSTGFIHLSILLKHKKCDENCIKNTKPETCFSFD